MFPPKRGNHGAETRVNGGELLDTSEEAKALLRGVFSEGNRIEFPRNGSSLLPDQALQISTRNLCPPVTTKSQSLQTTYTTAGTIYDPNSRLLIHPPNRRGRSSKHGPSNPLADQTLLAGSASLLEQSGRLEGAGGGRMTTAASLRNYTPLQQNYDRAINPCNEVDGQHSVSMALSRRKPSDGLPPHYFEPELDDILACMNSDEGDKNDNDSSRDRDHPDGKTILEMRLRAKDSGPNEGTSGDILEDDGSDTEDDWGMDPLMNMPVKSLHNLASYPNPNQKKAQKILLLGAKPKLMKTLRMNSSVPAALGSELSRRREASLGYDESPGFDTYHREPSFSMLDDFQEPPSINPLPPGAPKPLTAGPPGLRQYRPSNLGSVPRALSPRLRLISGYPFGKDQMSSLARNLPTPFSGSDDAKVASASSSTSGRYTHEVPEYPKLMPSDVSRPMELSLQGAQDYSSDPWSSSSVDPRTNQARQGGSLLPCTHTTNSRDVANQSAESMLDDGHYFQSDSWKLMAIAPREQGSDPPDPRPRWDPGVGRLSADQIAERNERIHSLWFRGSASFDISRKHGRAPRDQEIRPLKNIFGAIGDGRPQTESKTNKTSIEL